MQLEKSTFIGVKELEKEIFLSDLEDQMNMPRAYNTKVRGFKKVASYISENRAVLEKMSMFEVIHKLDEIQDLSFKSYCAMD